MGHHRGLAGGLRLRGVCVVGALLLVPLGSGCVQSPAMQTVVSQNEANSNAYAANVATLAAAAREMASVQAALIRRAARERVSADLIRIRSTVGLGVPTDAELTSSDRSWVRSLGTEVETLAARVNAAAPERRAVVAAALADDHGATIDLAVATPGFSAARVLRDAVALDDLNARIEAEPVSEARGPLLERRDAMLDAYMAARLSAASADQLVSAFEQLAQTTERQGAVLGMHAAALHARAARPETAMNIWRDPELRTASIDVVTQIWGQDAGDQVRERLRRLDAAVAAVATAHR